MEDPAAPSNVTTTAADANGCTGGCGPALTTPSTLQQYVSALDGGAAAGSPLDAARRALSECDGSTLDLSQLGLSDADLATLWPLVAPLAPRLTTLNLFFNELTLLPACVAECSRLERLLVGANPLTTLAPGCLAGLTALTFLDVGYSDALTTFPAETGIGSCTALTILRAGNGRLSALPDDLWALPALTEVHAYGNCLTSLGDAIGAARRLTVLNVGRNGLTSLPSRLGECGALQVLAAYENALTGIPRSVAALPRLRVLNVDFNQGLPPPPPAVRRAADAKVLALFLSGGEVAA
ncbi:hypothetical protein MMPV_006166 [Pyropia vietnamensis]